MLAIAKKGNSRRKSEVENRTISIPVIVPESHAISSDYILQCIEDGIFTTSYPAAKMMFDVQNIVQMHRDLNGNCPSLYRRRMVEKLGRPESIQVEFYIPSPEKLEEAKLHFIQLAIEEEMYAASFEDAYRKFGEGNFTRTVWYSSELSGRKKELAKAMGISGPSVMFFTPSPYVYGELS